MECIFIQIWTKLHKYFDKIMYFYILRVNFESEWPIGNEVRW